MSTINRIKQSIIRSIEVKEEILANNELIETIADVTNVFVYAFKRGNRVFFAGNGGSAADAQHLAAEFVSRFEFDREGLPALSLSTDTSMITAISNDYGYERIFLRQLQAQARSGDVFVGITTSGKSPNVLSALAACKDLQLTSVAMCGLGGEFQDNVDHVIRAPSHHTPRIQECHTLIGHIICAEVELQMFGKLTPEML